jgi:hypothetical protein
VNGLAGAVPATWEGVESGGETFDAAAALFQQQDHFNDRTYFNRLPIERGALIVLMRPPRPTRTWLQ